MLCPDFEESDPTSHGIDEMEAAFLVGGLVMPGSESTSALLNWLVRGLAKWPNVQQETREELDRVVGFDRTHDGKTKNRCRTLGPW